MDSFEFNKIAGAVLGTALFVMALSITSEIIYEPVEAHTPGYEVAIGEPAAGAGGGGAVVPSAVVPSAPAGPIGPRLAAASVSNGESVAKKCVACHTLLNGQAAKVGPNLWGVVGAEAAHQAGFKYSEALLGEKGKGLAWTYENLDRFLAAPKMFLPGTAMSFAGLPKPEDRADVIAYLRTLSDNPPPLPTTAAAAAVGGPAAPATTSASAAPAPPAAPRAPAAPAH
jgi:cytochrome c